MRSPFTQLYVHLVWATWGRLPLITSSIKGQLIAGMAMKCRDLGAEPIAVGVVADHVHLLVRLSPTLSVSALVKGVKGASSHLVTHALMPSATFKWQGGYGAFTITKDDVPVVIAYIENQERHHESGDLRPAWEGGGTGD